MPPDINTKFVQGALKIQELLMLIQF